jgi:dTDP-4-dehydrorhamnose reductase
MTTLLVIGGTGQIGYELVRELAPLGRVVAPRRMELDLSDFDSIRSGVRAVRPAVILNAAAYTAVDQAESDAIRCARINSDAPGVLAEEARRAGAVLVHYSTDYVFDGTNRAPYVEDDEPRPLQAYGRTKLEGERAVAAVGGAHLVLRTSWVYGARGRNFLRTILAKARTETEPRVVDDQVGAPTWSRLVAGATACVVSSLLRESAPAGRGDVAGVFHLSAAGQTTWHGFAEEILRRDPAREEQVCGSVRRVSSSEMRTPARRPAYSVLDNGRIAARFGVRLPDWRDQLRLALEA